MSKLVFLGTSGAMPTIERGLSCTVLVLEKEYIMVDCGDGTGRQYEISHLKWNKPMTVLITHMHLDHISGLLALFQSMDLKGRTEPITVYGIRGIRKYIEDCNRSVNFKFGFEFEIIELDEREYNTITLKSGVNITTCKTKHQCPSIAYRVELPDKEGTLDIDLCKEFGVPEKSPLLGKLKRGEDVEFKHNGYLTTVRSKDVVGKKQKGLTIAFSGDTRPIDTLIPFFSEVDYLLYESTFLEDEQELAIKAKHSTAKEAGMLADASNVKTLLLNHFSARHTNTKGFYEDASKHHHNVIVTRDFLEIELK